MEQRTRREAELEVEEIKMFMASLGASGLSTSEGRCTLPALEPAAEPEGRRLRRLPMCAEDGR